MLVEVVKNISDMLDDEFNADDHSVGIYPVGKVDKEIVNWIEENCEGVSVQAFKDERFTLMIDNTFIVVCELVSWYDGIDQNATWQVTSAYGKYKGDKIK